MSFYGNTVSDVAITYDIIYPNRVAMENDKSILFSGRNVLIEYSYGGAQKKPDNYDDKTRPWESLSVYEQNAWIDKDRGNFDSTLWQRLVGVNGQVEYIQIGSLNGVGFRTITFEGAEKDQIIRGSDDSFSTLTFGTYTPETVTYGIDPEKHILYIDVNTISNEIDGGEG